VSIEVPALRDRREDVPALAVSILDGLSARIGVGAKRISPEAVDALCSYSWPGNVRELINVLERAVLLSDQDEITTKDLPVEIAADAEGKAETGAAAVVDLVPEEWFARPLKEMREATLVRFEKAYLTRLLTVTGGRIGETARRAGMEPRSLFNKMRRYGLRKEDFRGSGGNGAE
jgi:DNA-binding NtrC family response regulator